MRGDTGGRPCDEAGRDRGDGEGSGGMPVRGVVGRDAERGVVVARGVVPCGMLALAGLRPGLNMAAEGRNSGAASSAAAACKQQQQ